MLCKYKFCRNVDRVIELLGSPDGKVSLHFRNLVFLNSVRLGLLICTNESVLRISGQSIGVSASPSVLPMNTQD